MPGSTPSAAPGTPAGTPPHSGPGVAPRGSGERHRAGLKDFWGFFISVLFQLSFVT